MRIAQGKRSDTLGKPPHHATPCKGKSKRNTLCFSTFSITWRNLHGNIIPRVPLRLPLGYELLPLWGVPVLTSTHTTLRLRKICAICRAKGAICGSPSPRTASVHIREICGKIKTLHCYMLHVTIRWFHMSRSCRGAPLLLPMPFHEVGHDLAVRLIHLVSVEQCLVGRQLLADG